jgi:hypothetical protein
MNNLVFQYLFVFFLFISNVIKKNQAIYLTVFYLLKAEFSALKSVNGNSIF